MTFVDWLRHNDDFGYAVDNLDEIGTSTASVAGFARPITAEPVRRIKKRKTFGEWLKEKLNEEMPIAATQPANLATQPALQTPFAYKPRTVSQPTNQQPTQPIKPQPTNQKFQAQPAQPIQQPIQQATLAMNPDNYRGANKVAFDKVYNKFMQSKDPNVASVLQQAIQGNDTGLLQMKA